MVTAVALSFAAFGALVQVREGTIISALLVGVAVAFWGRVLSPLKRFVPPAPKCFIAPLIPEDDPGSGFEPAFAPSEPAV